MLRVSEIVTIRALVVGVMGVMEEMEQVTLADRPHPSRLPRLHHHLQIALRMLGSPAV
jgi:hypothetical protein